MAVTPRPASTVVLMNDQSKVYLTKRPITMKFMGGFYVFPGGSVDKEDKMIKSTHIKDVQKNVPVHVAHYVAAARELFEEVGVLLCRNKNGLPVQLEKEKANKYRRQLINNEITFLQMLQKEELLFSNECLTYFGHRITPSVSPIRFDTRFFLTYLPEGQTPDPDKNEIDEAHWMTPQEAIDAYKSGKISLASPTITSLQTILNHQQGGPLMMPPRRG